VPDLAIGKNGQQESAQIALTGRALDLDEDGHRNLAVSQHPGRDVHVHADVDVLELDDRRTGRADESGLKTTRSHRNAGTDPDRRKHAVAGADGGILHEAGARVVFQKPGDGIRNDQVEAARVEVVHLPQVDKRRRRDDVRIEPDGGVLAGKDTQLPQPLPVDLEDARLDQDLGFRQIEGFDDLFRDRHPVGRVHDHDRVLRGQLGDPVDLEQHAERGHDLGDVGRVDAVREINRLQDPLFVVAARHGIVRRDHDRVLAERYPEGVAQQRDEVEGLVDAHGVDRDVEILRRREIRVEQDVQARQGADGFEYGLGVLGHDQVDRALDRGRETQARVRIDAGGFAPDLEIGTGLRLLGRAAGQEIFDALELGPRQVVGGIQFPGAQELRPRQLELPAPQRAASFFEMEESGLESGLFGLELVFHLAGIRSERLLEVDQSPIVVPGELRLDSLIVSAASGGAAGREDEEGESDGAGGPFS